MFNDELVRHIESVKARLFNEGLKEPYLDKKEVLKALDKTVAPVFCKRIYCEYIRPRVIEALARDVYNDLSSAVQDMAEDEDDAEDLWNDTDLLYDMVGGCVWDTLFQNGCKIKGDSGSGADIFIDVAISLMEISHQALKQAIDEMMK